MKAKAILSLLIVFTLLTVVMSRQFRVNKIPNGFVNQCSNCHIDPNGGGPRNLFGQEVESRVSPNGMESFWDASLAGEDSDGDGFSNGQELQDPDGTWTEGMPNPGDQSLVTNPGDNSSHPDATALIASENIPNDYKLYNNYPNPFNPTTKIKFAVPSAGNVSLKIFNGLGQFVTELVNKELSAGLHEVRWNGKNQNGSDVSSGIYLYILSSGNFIDTKKMILLK